MRDYIISPFSEFRSTNLQAHFLIDGDRDPFFCEYNFLHIDK